MKPLMNKLNLGLAAGALVLVIVVLMTFRESTPEVTSYKMLDISRDAVQSLSASAGEERLYTLRRQNGTWQMTTPYLIAAGEWQVEDLLDQILVSTEQRYPVSEMDMSGTGLGQPVLKLRVNNQELLFGDTSPVDRKRYVRAGEFVYLVPDLNYLTLRAEAEDLIDRRLLGGEEPQGFIINGRSISADNSPSWTQYAGAWKGLAANEIWFKEDVESGMQLIIEFAGGVRREFRISGQENTLMFHDVANQLAYQVDREQVQALLEPGNAGAP